MANEFPVPVELADAELDAVAAGQLGNQQALGAAAGAAGLVAAAVGATVGAQVIVNDVLSHNDVDVTVAAPLVI
jgi:hypothetical protein